ncbi:DUF2975 domain-containing protein [Massilia suwonensis]|uniref:DUF2975 domain-containing protein n=1 Tax=Massilia suwonensis TaxID=648895 RepID=A0ABW0MIB0_9BURK
MTRHVRVVRTIAGVLALLQLLYFTLSWLWPEASQLGPVHISFTPRGLETGVVAGLPPALRWSGMLCALPALLLLVYAFLRLDRMLRACASGRMFALETVGHMKAFAAALLGALLLTVLEPALRALVWRLVAGGPPRPVNVGVSSEELMLVLICALFFVVASMMHEARRLAEDNEGFV